MWPARETNSSFIATLVRLVHVNSRHLLSSLKINNMLLPYPYGLHVPWWLACIPWCLACLPHCCYTMRGSQDDSRLSYHGHPTWQWCLGRNQSIPMMPCMYPMMPCMFAALSYHGNPTWQWCLSRNQSIPIPAPSFKIITVMNRWKAPVFCSHQFTVL